VLCLLYVWSSFSPHDIIPAIIIIVYDALFKIFLNMDWQHSHHINNFLIPFFSPLYDFDLWAGNPVEKLPQTVLAAHVSMRDGVLT